MQRSTYSGKMVMPIDRELLEAEFDAMKGVQYRLGEKNPKTGFIDCSGLVRRLLTRACTEHVDVPDGSQNQRAWCKRMGFKQTDYRANAGACDGRLRIAFLSPKPGKAWPRHVWLCLGRPGDTRAMTMESFGGYGVGRRWWNNQQLKGVSACFVLTDVLE